jgi:hypothetical protein
METTHIKGIKQKMGECRLRSGVNWQMALNQQGITLG